MLSMGRVTHVLLFAILHVASGSRSFSVNERSRIEVVGNYSAVKADNGRVLLGHMKVVVNDSAHSGPNFPLIEVGLGNSSINCTVHSNGFFDSERSLVEHEVIFQLVGRDLICSVDPVSLPDDGTIPAMPPETLLMEIKFAPRTEGFVGCVSSLSVIGVPVLCSEKGTSKLHVRSSDAASGIKLADENLGCSRECIGAAASNVSQNSLASAHLQRFKDTTNRQPATEAQFPSTPSAGLLRTLSEDNANVSSPTNSSSFSNSRLLNSNDADNQTVIVSESHSGQPEVNNNQSTAAPSVVATVPVSSFQTTQSSSAIPTPPEFIPFTAKVVNLTTVTVPVLLTDPVTTLSSTTLTTAESVAETDRRGTTTVAASTVSSVSSCDEGKCLNGGSCSTVEAERGNCSCAPGFYGEFCELITETAYSSSNKTSASSHAGEIAGGVLGSLAVVALIIGGAFLYRYIRRSRRLKGKYNPAKEEVLAAGQNTNLPMMPISKEERLI